MRINFILMLLVFSAQSMLAGHEAPTANAARETSGHALSLVQIATKKPLDREFIKNQCEIFQNDLLKYHCICGRLTGLFCRQWRADKDDKLAKLGILLAKIETVDPEFIRDFIDDMGLYKEASHKLFFNAVRKLLEDHIAPRTMCQICSKPGAIYMYGPCRHVSICACCIADDKKLGFSKKCKTCNKEATSLVRVHGKKDKAAEKADK